MAHLRQRALLVTLAIILPGGAVSALAQDDGAQIVVRGRQMPPGYGPVEQRVRIGDLNLLSREGVSTMEARVTNAVDRLCRVTEAASAAKAQEARNCRDFAWSSTRPQMAEALRAARAGGARQ